MPKSEKLVLRESAKTLQNALAGKVAEQTIQSWNTLDDPETLQRIQDLGRRSLAIIKGVGVAKSRAYNTRGKELTSKPLPLEDDYSLVFITSATRRAVLENDGHCTEVWIPRLTP